MEKTKMDNFSFDLVVVGGGAAGFFCAIQCAEQLPGAKIVILENSKNVLRKVEISGGGRCNVTHACFDPKILATRYPRGGKELLGPFHTFHGENMVAWLAENGVKTHTEEDGRVFPTTNRSETIINCFLERCKSLGIKILTEMGAVKIVQKKKGWQVLTRGEPLSAEKVMVASGASPFVWKMLSDLGHSVVEPVPSLFTFISQSPLLFELAGISLPKAHLEIEGTEFKRTGPLLITHWGISGPVVLGLSAWAARTLFEQGYVFHVTINWVGVSAETVVKKLEQAKKESGKKAVKNNPLFSIPKRLWERFLAAANISSENFGTLKTAQTRTLVMGLCQTRLAVTGKSNFKEEFVTAGGIDTREVNFKSMESKRFPGLYFAGEVLNIDGETGGFNFQAAWTAAFVAAQAISRDLKSSNP